MMAIGGELSDHHPLGGGVLPHLGVHRRSEQNGRPGGDQCGGDQIVADPGGETAEKRGGRRGDDDQIRPLGQLGVRAHRACGEQVIGDGVPW